MKGHLAAFEADAGAAAGTGFLAFVAFTRGLTVTGAFAAAETLDAVRGTGVWAVIVELHIFILLDQSDWTDQSDPSDLD